jgi:uncharacterized protein involved in exopolysaccharide biosynthesis
MPDQPLAPPRDVTIADLVQWSRDAVAALWHERRRIYRALAVTIPIGLLVAFGSRSEYTAGTKLLPYRNAGGIGQLSSLAGLAGIRLPSGGTEQTITADLYPVIARTLDFRLAVAETPLRFTTSSERMSLVAFHRADRSAFRLVVEAPGRLRRAVGEALSPPVPVQDSLLTGSDGRPLRAYARDYLSIVRELDERLLVSIDRRTSVIALTGKMPDRYAAADLVRTASERLMERIIEYEAKKAGEQLAFVEEQHRQSRLRYEQAQRALAEFADRNRMLVSAVSQIERDRLQREFEVTFQVFQQFSLELEQARIRKNQDTPVFTVLEEVTVPAERTSPRRSLVLLLAVFVGIAVGVLRIIWVRQVGGASR